MLRVLGSINNFPFYGFLAICTTREDRSTFRSCFLGKTDMWEINRKAELRKELDEFYPDLSTSFFLLWNEKKGSLTYFKADEMPQMERENESKNEISDTSHLSSLE